MNYFIKFYQKNTLNIEKDGCLKYILQFTMGRQAANDSVVVIYRRCYGGYPTRYVALTFNKIDLIHDLDMFSIGTPPNESRWACPSYCACDVTWFTCCHGNVWVVGISHWRPIITDE